MVVAATATLAIAYCFDSGAFVGEEGGEENATPKAVREKKRAVVQYMLEKENGFGSCLSCFLLKHTLHNTAYSISYSSIQKGR